ncbi:solute carrier family 34 (sodium-dependent phosphate cotransporter) [Kushneria avicenniae]|uniref:Solute carrier family 34 (Sodium-dependent phosphate cotransporter) n=1 Tax=Kushneria avicenniae TaxID=402385 RepID=A0A1I1M3L6_9GAMM|nr:sodium:phosphate symporter [Kushneria avicenniae]SFC80097.1 solute carrier family 34 (sodium-dependent phosphate cotransporter) [Kushneria avicenniae]
MAEATGKTVDQSADYREESQSRSGRVRQWLTLFLLIYCLVCAVSVIGDGFGTATGDHAEQIFNFATNPFVGLMVGIVATSLIQSSSTVTSIIVAMVAGGLPVAIAVPMVMGANIGTTMTNTLVSLGHVRDKDEFRRAFAAATVHDFFNFLAVSILLPFEILFSPLEHLAEQVAIIFYGDANLSIDNANLIGFATDPITGSIERVVSGLPDILGGLVMIAVGVTAILMSIRYIGKLLKNLMVGRAKRIMNSAIGRGPVTGVTSGALITTLVQSSSTTTSLMVPLAGSGTFSLKQIYPFTIGSNIGTTFTALLAATAISGSNATLALEIALVHLFFNLFAMLIIGGLPFLRTLPIKGAERLASLAAERKTMAAAWVVGAFIALPAALIAITAVTG